MSSEDQDAYVPSKYAVNVSVDLKDQYNISKAPPSVLEDGFHQPLCSWENIVGTISVLDKYSLKILFYFSCFAIKMSLL